MISVITVVTGGTFTPYLLRMMVEQNFDEQAMATYRRKLNHQLEPLKVMLVHRKIDLPTNEWIDFLNRTEQSVLTNPDQFFEKDLPEKELFTYIIETIFEEFRIRETSEQ